MRSALPRSRNSRTSEAIRPALARFLSVVGLQFPGQFVGQPGVADPGRCDSGDVGVAVAVLGLHLAQKGQLRDGLVEL